MGTYVVGVRSHLLGFLPDHLTHGDAPVDGAHKHEGADPHELHGYVGGRVGVWVVVVGEESKCFQRG